MRIGIDAREIQDGVFTGIGRALYDLIRYAEAHMPPEDSLVLFAAKPLPFAFSAKVVVHLMPERVRLWWDQFQLAAGIRHQKVDVFYSPYYKFPLLAPCRKVAAVLDLIYLEYPEYRRKLSPFAWMYYMSMGCWFAHAADRVLTCSHFSREDIVRTYGISSRKISVIPLAVSGAYSPLMDLDRRRAVQERYGITGRYILYAGNFKPHKNVPALVEAFRLLVTKYTDLKLVLVGPKAHGHEALGVADLGGRIVFTGTITDQEDGRALYSGAEVFVMPSLYEGFGLPPLEAMACAAPVVCSMATSLPEVVGDAALGVDARDPAAMAAAIAQILDDPALRAGLLIKGLRQAAQFNEERITAQVWSLLKEVGR